MELNLGVGLWILEAIIIAEAILIVVLIIATYVFKWISMRQAKRREKISQDITNHFESLIKEKKPFTLKNFPRRWRKFRLFMPVFFRIKKKYATDPAWQQVEPQVVSELIHPIAQRKYNSFSWINRFFACEAFSLMAKPEDEKRIIALAKDRVPLVYIHALKAAMNVRSEQAFNILLNRKSKMSWLAQTLNMDEYDDSTELVASYVEKRLATEKDKNVRAASYNILNKLPPKPGFVIPDEDLYSDNVELRMAALKYYVSVNKKGSVPVLTKFLNDKAWQTKIFALHRLGELKDKEALPAISKALNDEVWWVRLTAAEVLRGYGTEGETLLRQGAPELEKINPEALKHLTHTVW